MLRFIGVQGGIFPLWRVLMLNDDVEERVFRSNSVLTIFGNRRSEVGSVGSSL